MIPQRANAAPARMGWYWTCQAIGWSAVCGIALSHWWRGFLRERGWLVAAHRTPWAGLAGCIVLLGGIQVLLVAAAFVVLRPAGPVSGFGWLPSAQLFWIFIFLVWTALYGSVSAMRRARRFESGALRLEILAKDAELRALQAQINPRFFFNSLNSVRALIFESPSAAAHMIDQLASLMRYALQYGGAASVSVGQEIEAVRAYLAIEKIRFEERLRCHIEVAPELVERRIPPNYTRVYFAGHRPLVLRSLSQLEARLDPQRYFRANRRHIVNLDYVAGVTPTEAGLDLLLQDTLTIDVSRRRAAEFRALTSL